MRHSTLWLAAIVAAVASCAPRNCTSPAPALPPDALQALTAGTNPADSLGEPPMVDGLPECEAR